MARTNKIGIVVALVCMASACAPSYTPNSKKKATPDQIARFEKLRAQHLANVRRFGAGKNIQSLEDKIFAFGEENQIQISRMGLRETQRKSLSILVSDFKDPEAAKFRELYISQNNYGVFFCGQVNGKNSYGAYTGYNDFVASVIGGFIEKNRHNQSDRIATYVIKKACSTQ